MRRLLKIEFSRALRSKLLLAALLIGIGIVITHFLLIVVPQRILMDNLLPRNGNLSPSTAFNYWIGNSSFTWETTLYFLLVPILATLPYADSFFTDHKSGYVKNIYIRVEKTDYIGAKFVAVFVIGGCAVILPLILDFLLTAAALPSLMPQITSGAYGILGMWGSLFFEHPHIYLLSYLALDFIYGGLFASLALAISFFVENRFFVLLTPFMLVIIWRSLSSLLNLKGLDPSYFLMSSQFQGATFMNIALEALLIAAISCGIYFRKGIHNDTF